MTELNNHRAKGCPSILEKEHPYPPMTGHVILSCRHSSCWWLSLYRLKYPLCQATLSILVTIYTASVTLCPMGTLRTNFHSVLYNRWPFNYSFIHSFNRPLFSTNHMQAPRTERSDMLILVLDNVTVHYISSLKLLFCRGNTLCPL